MYLLDTNIFLEILLSQSRAEYCKNFINNNLGNIYMSDFSLHSIGVILLRYKKYKVLSKFIEDTLGIINLVSLPINSYKEIPYISKELKLDFDDAYQYMIANSYNFKIVTMDSDFEVLKDIEVIFVK